MSRIRKTFSKSFILQGRIDRKTFGLERLWVKCYLSCNLLKSFFKNNAFISW